ncbi:MAG: hypothetical protein QM796_20480 [Chthoniobacteraceae bacterium]
MHTKIDRKQIYRPATAWLQGSENSGVALIIVLAFVVLLTGLVVAYFSRAISDRQISTSSASQTRVQLFTLGVSNTIVDDLRQEIAAGSTPVTVGTSSTSIIFYPNPGAMMPNPVFAGSATPNPASVPNLVKQSASGQSFFQGANYSSNYPASNRAAGISTSKPSLNGRSISPARWNKPLLLQPTSATDQSADIGVYKNLNTPDWVLVTRNGNNITGTTLPVSAVMRGNKFTGNANIDGGVVVGRYAYNIYDEGGLLDVNVAGYPSPSPTGTPLPAFKSSEAFADLTQLTDAGGSQLLTTDLINSIVGWRNYATCQSGSPSGVITGSFPNFGFNQNATAGYYRFASTNTNGFLRSANQALVGGQSDHTMASRSQMIAFFTSMVPSASIFKVQKALQYFTNFTRDLNQPSYIPAHVLNPSAPVVQPTAQGGNYEGPGQDDVINPSFLTVRVKATTVGGRNDGSSLVAGEPLVKKRFALSRLAWLTYKGPSFGRTGADITDLTTNCGISQSFLDQGTTDNIQKYFGLRWATDHWVYDVHSTTGVKTLTQVLADNREPDFFELLKASISAGALGKSLFQSGNITSVKAQFLVDSSIDCQVIQIGANIIDQFDVDGFPTRIQFPAYSREFRGVENLPYLYRVRSAAWRVADPDKMPPDRNAYKQTTKVAFTNPGTVAMMMVPELWNPHYYDATASSQQQDRILGNPRPSALRFYAYTAPPDISGVPTGVSGYSIRVSEVGINAPIIAMNGLNATNTRMDLTNTVDRFREPTMLLKPGGDGNVSAPGLNESGLASGGSMAIINDSVAADSPAATLMPAGAYVGIYVGKVPILWNSGSNTYVANRLVAYTGSDYNNEAGTPEVDYQVLCENPNQGGSFQVYDEKYGPMVNFTMAGRNVVGEPDRTILSKDFYPIAMMGMNRFATVFDPRTSRFGLLSAAVTEQSGGPNNEIPPGRRTNLIGQMLNTSRYIMPTMRPDNSAGYGLDQLDGVNNYDANGSYLNNLGWSVDTTAAALLRVGLLSQNSKTETNDLRRFSGDSISVNTASNPGPAEYYQDPDGVVRRGMAAYFNPASGGSGAPGQPMATAFESPLEKRQKESRPIILNRPFLSVGELGYVFSGTPFKDLDLATPESGYGALLDVFCTNDTNDPNGLVAGRVNLNSRQTPVLQALLSGAGATNTTPPQQGRILPAKSPAPMLNPS